MNMKPEIKLELMKLAYQQRKADEDGLDCFKRLVRAFNGAEKPESKKQVRAARRLS